MLLMPNIAAVLANMPWLCPGLVVHGRFYPLDETQQKKEKDGRKNGAETGFME